MSSTRLCAALDAWDRRSSNRAEDLAALGSELAAAAREALVATVPAPTGHGLADLRKALEAEAACKCRALYCRHISAAIEEAWRLFTDSQGGAR